MTFINYGEITVAQKLLVDPLAVAGSDAFLGGFRYVVPSNALRVADGTIPVVFHGGLGFTADGRLCVQSGPMPITSYVNGLAMTTTGQVLVDSASPPVWSAHGWPISALSKLCVEGVVPPSSAVAHFPGVAAPGNQFIDTPTTWTPATQFAIEWQAKFLGTPGTSFYPICTMGSATPSVNLCYNSSNGFYELRIIDPTNSIQVMASATPPAFNVTPMWFRLLATIGGNYDYFSSPDRVVWTPMGSVTNPLVVSISTPTQPLNVGGGGAFYAFQSWKGDIGRVQVWTDIARTVQAFDMDPSKWVSGTTFVSGGATYTLTGGVTIS